VNALDGACKLSTFSSIISKGQVVAVAGYSKKSRNNATGKPNIFDMTISQEWQFNAMFSSQPEFGVALTTLNT